MVKEEIMTDPICCEPKEYSFLEGYQYLRKSNPKETKYGDTMKPRKTVEQIEEIEKSLVEVLDYPILYSIFEDIELSTQEKLNRVNNHLESLYERKKMIQKREDLQKVNREIRHFLEVKRELLDDYQKEMSSLDDIKEIIKQKEEVTRLIKNI